MAASEFIVDEKDKKAVLKIMEKIV